MVCAQRRLIRRASPTEGDSGSEQCSAVSASAGFDHKILANVAETCDFNHHVMMSEMETTLLPGSNDSVTYLYRVPRSHTNGGGEVEVTVTSERHALNVYTDHIPSMKERVS